MSARMEPEWLTRKQRIDTWLQAAGWSVRAWTPDTSLDGVTATAVAFLQDRRERLAELVEAKASVALPHLG